MLNKTVSTPAVALDFTHFALDVTDAVQPASTFPRRIHQFRRLPMILQYFCAAVRCFDVLYIWQLCANWWVFIIAAQVSLVLM